jgi:hypothetical protein
MHITKLHSSDHVTIHHLPIITFESQMNYLWFNGDDCNGFLLIMEFVADCTIFGFLIPTR